MKSIQSVLQISVIGTVLLITAAQASTSVENKEKRPTLKMWVASLAFKNGENIPKKFTRDGENISPALTWGGIPAATKSFVIICDDIDAPSGSFIHWIVVNIPADKFAAGIPENFGKKSIEKLESGAVQGTTGFDTIGYDGAAPPRGQLHRYIFTVYALDTLIKTQANIEVSAATITEKMSGHILAQAEIMGMYKR